LTRAVTKNNVYESIRLSRAHDLLYLCNYKAACTTLLLCMARRERELGLIDLEPDADSVHVDDIFKILDFSLAHPRPFTFSFVKNPYARALSAYLDKIHPCTGETRALFCKRYQLDPSSAISFSDYLRLIQQTPACEQDVHWRAQANNLMLGGLEIDFVGHVECFDEDFASLASQTGLGADAASVRAGMRHGTSARLRLAEFYGAREVALVNEIYEEDFRAFGYRHDPGVLAPSRRGLRFEITDPILHDFIAAVGLRRPVPSA
jgi:hypothetical protein